MAPDPEHDSKAFPTDLNDLGGWAERLPDGFTPKPSAPSGSNTTNNNNDQGDAS
jgi:hypothetical protein